MENVKSWAFSTESRSLHSFFVWLCLKQNSLWSTENWFPLISVQYFSLLKHLHSGMKAGISSTSSHIKPRRITWRSSLVKYNPDKAVMIIPLQLSFQVPKNGFWCLEPLQESYGNEQEIDIFWYFNW
jgi:hypothetical protein